MSALPGEVITQGIADQLIEESPAIWAFMYGLEPVQKQRFYELLHEMVFVGYRAMEARQIPAAVEFDKELQAERRLGRDMSIYAMGVRDHIHLIDEGEI